MNALSQCVEEIAAQAAGVIELRLMGASDGKKLLLAALAGDAVAASLIAPFTSSMEQISRMSKRQPALCATCPKPLTGRDFSIGIASPRCDKPSVGLGFGLCARCGGDPAALQAKALTALRRIWPDACSVTIHPAGRT